MTTDLYNPDPGIWRHLRNLAEKSARKHEDITEHCLRMKKREGQSDEEFSRFRLQVEQQQRFRWHCVDELDRAIKTLEAR